MANHEKKLENFAAAMGVARDLGEIDVVTVKTVPKARAEAEAAAYAWKHAEPGPATAAAYDRLLASFDAVINAAKREVLEEAASALDTWHGALDEREQFRRSNWAAWLRTIARKYGRP